MDRWTHIKIKIGSGNIIKLGPRSNKIYLTLKDEGGLIETISYEDAKALILALQYIIDANETGNWPDG